MKKIKWALLTSALILILTVCCSCGGDKPAQAQLYAMNTVVNAGFYGGDGSKLVNSELNRLEKLMSVTDENSDIYRLNASNGVGTLVSGDTVEVLNKAMSVYTDCGGCFDPTVYPLVKLWGFTTDEYNVPDDGEINELLPLVDFSKVKIDGNTVTLPKGAAIDLGGIAKGYAGESCRRILTDNGITSAIISIGGNVQTVGLKPDGSLWNVALKNPDGGENLCTVRVGECAVVTSGGYERYFERGGKRYHHIIDPKTGRPAESEYKSVTVICGDGAEADALSTAFFVGGEKTVKEYLSKHPDTDVILYTRDNEFYVTRGIYGSIEFNNGDERDSVHYID